MSSVDNIVSVLDTFESNNSHSFYVPSLKREVKFKPINTGQQKSLLKAAIDNPVFQTRFVIATYNIITENCLEKEIVSKLTVVDSSAILIQYKTSIYGADYIVEKDGSKIKVDLNNILNKFKQITLPQEEVVADENISLTIGVPSLQDQYLLESQVRDKNLTDEEILKKNTEISAMLGEAFVSEVSKYIKSISISINGSLQDVNYKNLPPVKKLLVVEKLPSTTVKKAISYMSKITTLVNSTLQVQGKDVKTESTETVEISVDSTLFPVE